MTHPPRTGFAFGVLLTTFGFIMGCGNNQPKTLASLATANEAQDIILVQEEPITEISHQELRQEYKELVNIFEEERLKEQIERRIADVYMMESIQDQYTGKDKDSYYSEATEAYLEILRKYPNSPDNAEVLYQLSKAYDIEGEQERALIMLTRLTNNHPNYPNIDEAHFRKGDIHFNNEQYTQAEYAYQAVIDSNNPKLSLNAHYMLGWSHYKQLDYRLSVDSFSYVLGQLLSGSPDVETLDKKDKPLVEDTISSISLGLDKLGGAEQIELFSSLSSKNYVWRVYENLGDYYLNKELFEKSAGTYRLYVTNYSDNNKAPDLHDKMIDTYLSGGFANQGLKEKANYVQAYGINSDFTARRNGVIANNVSESLRQYIDELASHYHSKGQLYEKELAELNKDTTPLPDKEDKRKLLFTTSIDSFSTASDFYAEYLQTFSTDERFDEITFLKAEALYSAYRYPEAITDYESVAYQAKGNSAADKANDSGYAAIISYRKHIESLKTGQLYPDPSLSDRLTAKPLDENSDIVTEWRQKEVNSMLQFAQTFHTDERSPSVLTSAAESLFSLDQYQRAIEVSNNLIVKTPDLDNTLKKTAYGIIAHSYFKLEDYQNAEDNYLIQRELVDNTTEEYRLISERLATAVYKKSEVLIAQDQKATAIGELLKLKVMVPNSPIRITAQYDATTLLLEAKRWNEAIDELLEMQELYPDYEFAVEYTRKLAYAYEQNQEWGNAAEAYLVLVNQDPDPGIQEEALFVAANMYEKDENTRSAIYYFRKYVEDYPDSFDNRVEAQYHLITNYVKVGDIKRKNIWLNRTIALNRKAGSKATDRSRWLAAWSNAEYGDYYAEQFHKVKLSLPIVESIPAKNDQLQKASKRYQAAADYGIFEFVTLSSYKIGVLYGQFANELRGAPIPAGLSTEDTQIYTTIIEEQALPFDQLAIELHQANVERAWGGEFDQWIDRSFAQMRLLLPERFNKTELIVSYGDGIR